MQRVADGTRDHRTEPENTATMAESRLRCSPCRQLRNPAAQDASVRPAPVRLLTRPPPRCVQTQKLAEPMVDRRGAESDATPAPTGTQNQNRGEQTAVKVKATVAPRPDRRAASVGDRLAVAMDPHHSKTTRHARRARKTNPAASEITRQASPDDCRTLGQRLGLLRLRPRQSRPAKPQLSAAVRRGPGHSTGANFIDVVLADFQHLAGGFPTCRKQTDPLLGNVLPNEQRGIRVPLLGQLPGNRPGWFEQRSLLASLASGSFNFFTRCTVS